MAIKKICAAFVAAMLISSAATAADSNDEPSEVNADAIEYDMNSGIVSAEGNVLLKHGLTKATGLHAMFNVNTKEAHLVGNVIVVREDMRITCNTLASNGQGYMAADGNVVATQNVAPDEKYPDGDTRTFMSEHIDYFPDDRKHFVIPAGGVATSAAEGTFTADQMEGWLDEERYIGRGNAHLLSPARNMEAGGDQVDYDGKDAGKAVLSGNAWAYQNNNMIRGNRLTVYLADDGNLKAEAAPNFEMPQITPSETLIETPSETLIETPSETLIETPTETPLEILIETPTETPFETPPETLIETPSETLIETPTETPLEAPSGTLTETPFETPEKK